MREQKFAQTIRIQAGPAVAAPCRRREGGGGGRINDRRAQRRARIRGKIRRRVKYNIFPGGGITEAQLCRVQINAPRRCLAVKRVAQNREPMCGGFDADLMGVSVAGRASQTKQPSRPPGIGCKGGARLVSQGSRCAGASDCKFAIVNLQFAISVPPAGRRSRGAMDAKMVSASPPSAPEGQADIFFPLDRRSHDRAVRTAGAVLRSVSKTYFFPHGALLELPGEGAVGWGAFAENDEAGSFLVQPVNNGERSPPRVPVIRPLIQSLPAKGAGA